MGWLLISFVLKISKLQIAAYVSVLISGGSSRPSKPLFDWPVCTCDSLQSYLSQNRLIAPKLPFLRILQTF